MIRFNVTGKLSLATALLDSSLSINKGDKKIIDMDIYR